MEVVLWLIGLLYYFYVWGKTGVTKKYLCLKSSIFEGFLLHLSVLLMAASVVCIIPFVIVYDLSPKKIKYLMAKLSLKSEHIRAFYLQQEIHSQGYHYSFKKDYFETIGVDNNVSGEIYLTLSGNTLSVTNKNTPLFKMELSKEQLRVLAIPFLNMKELNSIFNELSKRLTFHITPARC